MPNKQLKIVIFSFSGEAAPVAIKLKQEGYPVTFAIIQDDTDIRLPEEGRGRPEDEEERKRRLSMLNGMVQRTDAKTALERLKQVPEDKRSEWFIFSDMNSTWKFTEQLEALGYNGLLLTRAERELEVNRWQMKALAKKYYDKLSVAEEKKFSKIEEALKFLEDTEDIWVLKGFSDDAETFCPDSDDPEIAKLELTDQLTAGQKFYEASGGFLLERKIPDGIELTPQLNFFNGKPVYATLDLELKRKIAGNLGKMVGCGGDLVFEIPLDSEILKLCFPKVVYDMAAEHKGWFAFDAGVMYSPAEDDFYFLEVCSRYGYNALLTELAVMPSVGHWFEALARGENPYIGAVAKYGASVRMFNDNQDKDNGMAAKDLPFYGETDNPNIWLMDVKKKGERLVCCGYGHDLAVATGIGFDPREAMQQAMNHAKLITFKKMTYRTDLLQRTYLGNILSRFNFGAKMELFPGSEVLERNLNIDFHDVISDEDDMPMEGAVTALNELAQDFRITVFTSHDDLGEVWAWLIKHGLGDIVTEVTHDKVRASAYIDDLAIRFRTWELTLSDLAQYASLDIQTIDIPSKNTAKSAPLPIPKPLDETPGRIPLGVKITETSVPLKNLGKPRGGTKTVLDLEKDAKRLQKPRKTKWSKDYDFNQDSQSYTERNPRHDIGDTIYHTDQK